MTTQLVRDSSFAPSSFLVVKVGDNGELADYRNDESSSVLVQIDWDFPSLATSFGWTGLYDHPFTDGTFNCPETGKTASEFISEAAEWLHENDGIRCEDVGYFS